MERYYTVLRDTDFKRDPGITLFIYITSEALDYYVAVYGETPVEWEKMPEYVHRAVYALDAAANEKGDASIKTVGSRTKGVAVKHRFIVYDIDNPLVKEVQRESV